MGTTKENEISFVGKVLDNVHGFIWYTEAEQRIMETLLFKRLQSIKQLSLVNWVFPGSEHTRFIHSLGVMHIADRMAQALHLPTRERKIVRLAGLLHDIGHYPLSHVCEFPYKKKMEHFSEADFYEKWNSNVKSRIESFSFRPITEYMQNAKQGHHEEIGSLVIHHSEEICHIIQEECGEDATEIICDMITGNIRDNTHHELLVQLLHSELDADGIDYLLRDAVFSGTSFGSFELDQLISNLCCYERKGRKILCVAPKGIAAADQYLLNKFFSYSQVVFNKHTSILEWMAEQIVSWMQEKDAYFPARETLRKEWVGKDSSFESFLSFTDDYFWHSLRNVIENPVHNALPQHVVSLCNALLNHQECAYVEGSEIKLITQDEGEFKKAIEGLDATGDNIILFSERSMTKQVPYEEFINIIKKPGEEDEDTDTKDPHAFENFKEDHLYRRLLECVCVWDKETDTQPHLLCDDRRSLMRQLYNVKLLLIRKYTIPQG